jgi:hypothetical protein
MRKYLAAGAVCAVAFGAVGTAQAGVEATDASGNFVVLDMDFNPPATSTKTVPGAASLGLNISFGNKRSGSPFPATQTFDLTVPGGGAYNGKFFPKCPLPKTPEDITAGCPKATQIGTGTAVIDARNLGVQEPIAATLTVYNGALRQGKATERILANATVGGSPITSELDVVYSGNKFSQFSDIQGATSIGYSYSSFNLDVGAVLKTKVHGKTTVIPLITTPRNCPAKGWPFTFTTTDTNGNKITATDRQPCVKVSG